MIAERGPTQTTDGADTRKRWAGRPVAARITKIGIALLPIALSLAFSTAMSQLLPPSRIGVNKWIWWIALICVTTLLLSRIDRIIRRLAPLSALLQLSLVFPDEAPSRYKSALRSFSARRVQTRLDSMKEAGFTLNDDENRSQQMLDLLAMLSDHDRMTRGHSERVRAYAEMIGAEMGLPDRDMEKLQWAALLHDLGKLTVPSEILNKAGKPDDDEWRVLSGHPAAGIPLAAPIADWLGDWTSAIGQHHERWDGKGYPDGFAGNDIPIGARIVAVADAYDVMTSARSYKKAFSADVARQEIASGAGSQFCPSVARALLAVPAGKLKAVAGPLSWLGGLPGLRNVPVAEVIGSSTITAASATLTAVSALAIVPSLLPLPASAEETQPPPATVIETTTTTASTTATTTTLPEDAVELLIEIPSAGSTIPPTSTSSMPTIAPATTTTTSGSSSSTTTTAPTTTAPTTTTSGPGPSTTTTAPTTTTTSPNNPPLAQNDSGAVLEGSAVVVNVLANDSDPDAGDTLVVASVGLASNGSIVNNGDGTVTYTHDGSQTAFDTFTYDVTDSAGEASSASVTVSVSNTNDAPTASADGFVTAPNTPIVISPAQLVANDNDEEDGAAPGAATVSLTAPAPGGATISQPGGPGTDVTLTPDPGEMTPQTFGYRMCDSNGMCDTALVTVGIDNGFGILISEFSTDDAYSQGNFVELYNASGSPIDISGWELRLARGSSNPADAGTWHETVTLSGPNTVIVPGGHYLVGKTGRPIAAVSDQTMNANYHSDFGIGLHDGFGYVDVVGNRQQVEQGSVDEATLVDGRGVSPLKSTGSFDLSYVRRPSFGNGHCQDVDDNQYDWQRVTVPSPQSSADPAVTCSTPVIGPASSGLVISEFRTDGPFSGSNDFVEIFNPTGLAVALDGLQLRDELGSVVVTLNTFSLQPGQHYLVSGAGYSGANDQPYDTGGFTNGSAVEVWDPVAVSQIDYVDFGTAPPALPQLGQRLFDTYERRDGGCRDTDVWIDDFMFQMVISPQTSSDAFTPCP